ncbi:MAG: rRNA pseudouridine synthase [Alphaproteobacteria bacterium]|nr:rRNA pseudouridine synthase [Alphaproteobacteria bacterium]
MSEDKHKGERIAKLMARSGLCSRRDAERWIGDGRVAVNGVTLNTPACLIGPGDRVTVDGRPLNGPDNTRLWLYHKPAGLVTTHKDEHGRGTVFEALPKSLPRVISVGRLDLNTEGLLLLTNDGALARHLELPSTGWIRRYRVRVLGQVDPAKLDTLKNGVTVEGIRYKPAEARLETDRKGANNWIEIALQEGKNREVRRIMESLDLRVNRLIRISYGPFRIENMPVGDVREIQSAALKKTIPEYFS